MMFSYPYFNPPYYHRYSRYGYYYPNATSYASSANNAHMLKGNATTKQSNNTANINTNRVEQTEKKTGHSGVMSYKNSLKRCPYTGFFLCTNKGRIF